MPLEMASNLIGQSGKVIAISRSTGGVINKCVWWGAGGRGALCVRQNTAKHAWPSTLQYTPLKNPILKSRVIFVYEILFFSVSHKEEEEEVVVVGGSMATVSGTRASAV